MDSETQYLKNYHYSLQAYALVTIQHHKIDAFGLRNSWGQYKVNMRPIKVKFENLNSKMEQKCFCPVFHAHFKSEIRLSKYAIHFF